MKQSIINTVTACNGLYVGALTDAELRAFNLACKEGLAQRSYEGPAGFLGVAKVKILDAKRDND